MKNHFYIPYTGNKREEVEEIYNKINFNNIDTVIEPFCGSCAISYYIYTKNPNLKFVFNDNNKYLKEMYEIIKNDGLEQLQNEINDIIDTITLNENPKLKYNEIIKKDCLKCWIIGNKVYCIRPFMYPINKKITHIDLSKHKIIDFFKNGNITFTNIDGVECYKKYMSCKKNLIILDPPYISTHNDFYLNSSMEIYNYLYKNNMMKVKAYVMLILEDLWITNLLFDKAYKYSYNKKYNGFNKKQVNHTIYSNRKHYE
jgi:hypothetical protein